MKLWQLLAGVPLTGEPYSQDMEITSISYDTRTLLPGALFVALPGAKTDGSLYIDEALAKGAAAVVCRRRPQREGVFFTTPDPRRALALLAENWFGHPGREMTLIGVTGTNGKTTTTFLIKEMLEGALKTQVGLIGTIQNMVGERVLPAHRTTPESYEVQQLLREMADSGCTHVVMEVSSHALALERVWGITFRVGAFTNLTRDHLDFHRTMEDYCDAKALLFRRCAVAVVNGDDPWTPRLLEGLSRRGARATFFLVGSQIEGREDLVRRIRQEGHQIGSHSFSHRALTELSTADALADLEKCDRALRQVLGDGSYWLRPPYGFLSDRELCALGTPAICWSVDTEDWKSRDVDSILDIVLRRAGDGDILLLHDCYATSVTAALEIVDRLQPRGVRFVTVEELFAVKGVEPACGTLYYRVREE